MSTLDQTTPEQTQKEIALVSVLFELVNMGSATLLLAVIALLGCVQGLLFCSALAEHALVSRGDVAFCQGFPTVP